MEGPELLESRGTRSMHHVCELERSKNGGLFPQALAALGTGPKTNMFCSRYWRSQKLERRTAASAPGRRPP